MDDLKGNAQELFEKGVQREYNFPWQPEKMKTVSERRKDQVNNVIETGEAVLNNEFNP